MRFCDLIYCAMGKTAILVRIITAVLCDQRGMCSCTQQLPGCFSPENGEPFKTHDQLQAFGLLYCTLKFVKTTMYSGQRLLILSRVKPTYAVVSLDTLASSQF